MPEITEILAQWMVINHFTLDCQANNFKIYLHGLLADATNKEATSLPKTRWHEGKVDLIPDGSRRFTRGSQRIMPPKSIVNDFRKLHLRNAWVVSRRIIVLDFGSAWLALHLRTHCLIQIMHYEQFMNGVWDVPKKARFKIPLALQLGDPKLDGHTATAPSFFFVCTSQDMMVSIQWLRVPTQQKLISATAFARNTPSTILGEQPDVEKDISNYVEHMVGFIKNMRKQGLQTRDQKNVGGVVGDG